MRFDLRNDQFEQDRQKYGSCLEFVLRIDIDAAFFRAVEVQVFPH